MKMEIYFFEFIGNISFWRNPDLDVKNHYLGGFIEKYSPLQYCYDFYIGNEYAGQLVRTRNGTRQIICWIFTAGEYRGIY